VTYIDREGRGILADIYRQTHAQFKADTPLTGYYAEQARANNFKNENSSGNSKERGASK